MTGPMGTLVDVGFALCLVGLLVFLILQFCGSGKGD
jgi:hypothetical protein